MSTDIRALMRSLADDAPTLDNRVALADQSYAAGRRRRKIRHLEIAGAAAVVVLCALFATLFVGSSPLAAQYGTSSATHVTGYPRHIDRQWSVLDLPAKPGPIAGVLTDGATTWAVSPNGHRWRIADAGGQGSTTSVSADGRLISYLVGDEGPLRIRNLVTGQVIDVAGIGGNPGSAHQRFGLTDSSPPGLFSSDDRYLAFTAFDATQAGGGTSTVVVEIHRAAVIAATPEARVLAGWSADRVVTSAEGVQLESPTGQILSQTALRPTDTLPAGTDYGPGTAAAVYGQQLVVLLGGDSPTRVIRFDVASGEQRERSAVLPAATDSCSLSAGRNVDYLQRDGTAVVTVGSDGLAVRATSIDPDLHATCGLWASDAYDGSARGRLILDRVTGEILAWWVLVAWTVGSLLVLSVVTWRLRVFRRHFNASYAQFGRTPMTRRRKSVIALVVASSLLAVLGLLTPYVFLPLGAADLRAANRPLVLWLPVDEQTATSGAYEGTPAVVIVSRRPLQGFAVLVENRSRFDQTVAGLNPSFDGAASVLGLSVATTAGSAAQVRSLTYQRTAVIPAHQSRWVRDLTSTCVLDGGSTAQEAVWLTVKIGWITRNETVRLPTDVKTVASVKGC